ncbi:MAG: SAM-dependent methyltransferase [Lachnospiraceae bacterium]|nr:SAM-dependent methyltransferase [Lachnospiraceae bacterium]
MNIQLSKRMQAVADMVIPGFCVADIGCDHGFVSIYLIQNQIAPHVFAADVRPGPLSRAKEHIAQAGLSRYITPVLSDGLQNVPVSDGTGFTADDAAIPSAQAIVAAGIGGRLTVKILSDWPEKTKALSWMVLEPQSDIHIVRQWLAQNGFCILKENMVFEDGKYYPVLFAANVLKQIRKEEIDRIGQMNLSAKQKWERMGYDSAVWQECCDLYGMQLIVSGNEVLKAYLVHNMEKDRELLYNMEKAEGNERLIQRMQEIKDRLVLNQQILSFMEKY